jgi:hypothetical protein
MVKKMSYEDALQKVVKMEYDKTIVEGSLDLPFSGLELTMLAQVYSKNYDDCWNEANDLFQRMKKEVK